MRVAGAPLRNAARALAALVLAAGAAAAGPADFTPGPRIPDLGPNAVVPGAAEIPADATFRIRFDVSEGSSDGAANRTLVTATRLYNMHARAGLPDMATRAAIVVHGKAVFDVSKGASEENARHVAALISQGARIVVCGQSAVHYEVAAEDLLPGVELAISAMTAHGLLDAEGYILNPF